MNKNSRVKILVERKMKNLQRMKNVNSKVIKIKKFKDKEWSDRYFLQRNSIFKTLEIIDSDLSRYATEEDELIFKKELNLMGSLIRDIIKQDEIILGQLHESVMDVGKNMTKVTKIQQYLTT